MNTFQFLRKAYAKDIADGYRLRACYITSAGFYEDGVKFLEAQKKIRPSHLEAFYDCSSLLMKLEQSGLNVSRDTLERYYLKMEEQKPITDLSLIFKKPTIEQELFH